MRPARATVSFLFVDLGIAELPYPELKMPWSRAKLLWTIETF